ncbi:MAG: hypothetical protein K2J77_01005 [Oscillospiraceae bacterium]|nr:hypothetical protein [Oscillospiraceae bacterium]
MKKLALLLSAGIILVGLCGCKSKPNNENYFGGEGELKSKENIIYDDNSIYINFGYSNVKKYNKNSNTLTIACDDPACGHKAEDVNCKANMEYRLFNRKLVRIDNELVTKSDGTSYRQGYLYLCDENNKQVFKNDLPDGADSEHAEPSIGVVYALGDDYLVLVKGAHFYLLDNDFNVKFTVANFGPFTGGVFYVDGEIYYIDSLYRLMKLDSENGEGVSVNIGAKITEGFVVGNTLWFSDEKMALCSYDFKTGEIKEHAENAVRLNSVGKYIEYMVYGAGDVCLYDTETNEAHTRNDIDINEDELFFLDGNYYAYSNTKNTLTLYEDDLTTVIKTAALEA